jgi:CRISPR-associated protein Cas5t
MLRLRIKAEFAAFRTFTAGSYRPTTPFITPSAAYGLVLNLAGIESRLDDGESPMTLMRGDLPEVEIALGAVAFPRVQSIFQQLHNYPVGATGKGRAPECKGAKYNIQPIRREFLSGVDGYLCIRGNETLEGQARHGLKGGNPPDGLRRYGIPFLGDNSFMLDVLREEDPPKEEAHWYQHLARLEPGQAVRYSRLSVWIDRANQTRTVAHLYAPAKERSKEPPDDAWTSICPPEGPL